MIFFVFHKSKPIMEHYDRWKANPSPAGPLAALLDRLHSDPYSPFPSKYIILVRADSEDRVKAYLEAVQRGALYNISTGPARFQVEDLEILSHEGGTYFLHSSSPRTPQFVQLVIMDMAEKHGLVAIPLKTFAH